MTTQTDIKQVSRSYCNILWIIIWGRIEVVDNSEREVHILISVMFRTFLFYFELIQCIIQRNTHTRKRSLMSISIAKDRRWTHKHSQNQTYLNLNIHTHKLSLMSISIAKDRRWTHNHTIAKYKLILWKNV